MFKILPLSRVPHVLGTCIGWTDREWSAAAGFSPLDWHAEFQRIEDDPVDEIFVAFLDGKPVGMAWMVEREGIDTHRHLTPWLSSLVVDPDYRDKGIASALVSHVERYAALGGDERLHLLTETPSYYFPMGWDVLDIAEVGDRSVYVMDKRLKQAA